MSEKPVERLVVAAALTDSLTLPRRLLAARRTEPAWARGLWEFAGGKVEPGETVEDALRRELREELGIAVDLGDEVRGPDRSLASGRPVWQIRASGEVPAPGVEPSPHRWVMRLFWCTLADGSAEPAAIEQHDAVRWLEPGTWRDGVRWLPADERIVDALVDDAVQRHRRAYC